MLYDPRAGEKIPLPCRLCCDCNVMRLREYYRMANPYVTVIGNICAGKSTFVNQFCDVHKDWYGLPEVLDENQRSGLRGPDTYYLYAAFFTDFYINRHLLSRQIPGPMLQESCLESSSLYPRLYYENNCFTHDKYRTLESKYAKYLEELPRPDFYLYLYAPVDVLLARAEIRKEPARTVSKLLIPGMQARLEEWVEEHVNPAILCKVNTQDMNMEQINQKLEAFQAQHRPRGKRLL
jgi:deoxyadenosine/deoxycytidine kinase